LINLDTPGGNQLKPSSIYHLSLDLHQFAYYGVLRLSTYDTNTHTSSHVLHQDRRSNTIWVVQKALYGAYITSRLGIKKFPWVTSIGASGAGATFVPITRTFTNFFFSNLGHLQHRTDTGYHTTREQGQHQEQLAGLGEGRLDDTLPCFRLCSLRVVSDLCLETYTGPIWNCNCHLPVVSSWDISEPPSLGGSVRRA
jgi:hypothetical protein